MQEFDGYFNALDELADIAVRAGVSALHLLEEQVEPARPLVHKLLHLRKSLISANDLERVQGYGAEGGELWLTSCRNTPSR